MNFRFNFGSNEDKDVVDAGSHSETCDFRKCTQHTFNKKNFKNVTENFHEFGIGDNTLYYLDPDKVGRKLQNEENLEFLESSDLQPGVYEGGLKVWECTFDLLIHLNEHKDIMNNAKVFDLGCGAGLLGCFSYLCNARKVYFQDYNSEVIEHFTLPCVGRTVVGSERTDNDEVLKFISGDWGKICEYFSEQNYPQFDLILSSETIYNTAYYSKLLNMLMMHLKSDGVALFAAKTHYFGVGGGTMDFRNYLENNGKFEIDVLLKYEDGVSREILRIKKC